MTDLKKLIPKWGTPAVSVYACTKCHKDMGAVISAKEESSINFTQSDNDLLCQSCFEELKKAVRDSKTLVKEK
jgi:DNA-directed RNA polymerase subunit RPC12/RpoP